MRRFCTSVGVSLAKETSHKFWAFLGVEWVVASGISMALFHLGGSPPVRLAFYEIVVVLIPVLLGVYVRERRAEIRSRTERHQRAQKVLQSADDAALDEEIVTRLREHVETGTQLLKAATALTALIPAAALTGEVIALMVIANGSSTTFSYSAVLMAAGFAVIGAVSETAQSFSRATK
jgi:hypothetical protein